MADERWSKAFPKVDGVYWLRFANPESQACIVEVVRSVVFQTGVVGDIRHRVEIHECEWLGPATPEDAEQLVSLRTAALAALRFIEANAYDAVGPVADQLRAALYPKGETKL